MGSKLRERQCSAKDCEALAKYECIRCGKALCKDHAHLVSLEHRLDPSEQTEGGPLAHLPSEIKTYAFCARCC
jgi:hypothetical protein